MGPGPGLRWDGMCKGILASWGWLGNCTTVLNRSPGDEKRTRRFVCFPYKSGILSRVAMMLCSGDGAQVIFLGPFTVLSYLRLASK